MMPDGGTGSLGWGNASARSRWGIAGAVLLTLALQWLTMRTVIVTAREVASLVMLTVLFAVATCAGFLYVPPVARTLAGTIGVALGASVIAGMWLVDDAGRDEFTAAFQWVLVGAIVLGGDIGHDIAQSMDRHDGVRTADTTPRGVVAQRWLRGIPAGGLAAVLLASPGSITVGVGQYGVGVLLFIGIGVAAGAAMGVSWTAFPTAVVILFLAALLSDSFPISTIYPATEAAPPPGPASRSDDAQIASPGVLRAMQLSLLLAAAAIPIMASKDRKER